MFIVVIGERIVTPSSIVYLVVKLRLSPPSSDSDTKTEKKELDAEETKKSIKANEEKDNEFLTGRNDVEPLSDEGSVAFAHAPYWPGVSISKLLRPCSLLTCDVSCADAQTKLVACRF